MTQFFIPFSAYIFAGTFDDISAAAEAYSPGSSQATGSNFVETESDTEKALAFTDANGNAATINKGDALQVVPNATTATRCYIAVPAIVVATWLPVPVSATSAPAAGS